MSDHEALVDDAAGAVTLRMAVGQLETRLAAFMRCFAAAIESDCRDEEVVHQLRVCARKSSAAIAIFSTLLPRKHVKWIRRQLQRVRRAAGVTRDLDVLIKRYRELADHGGKSKQRARRFLLRLRRRRTAHSSLFKLYARLIDSGKFVRHQQAMLAVLDSQACPEWDQPFRPWSKQRITPILAEFDNAGSSPLVDIAEVHAFRLRTKRLRYSLEVLADALPDSDWNSIKPVMSQLQSIQGEINDLAVARQWLKSIAKSATGKQRRFLHKQRRLARRQLQSALQRLHTTWTPQAAADLKSQIDCITG
ncbi:MAG: CHAD domain-containing protein [Pirellulaceae bacterium]|nr:CHAD domain-containing protein [Pirellulaceae bacterium]